MNKIFADIVNSMISQGHIQDINHFATSLIPEVVFVGSYRVLTPRAVAARSY